MMLASVVKGYFAAAAGTTPERVCSASVMPCVRKQGEADRPWFETETADQLGTVRDLVRRRACKAGLPPPAPGTLKTGQPCWHNLVPRAHRVGRSP